jgi:hypothetical protein
MANTKTSYPASLSVEYPKSLDRVSTLFRLFWAIPILIIASLLSGSTSTEYINDAGQQVTSSTGGILGGIAIATALMIVFRQKYPRWWFDFALVCDKLIEITYNFINDSFKLPVCLYYSPLKIALASIYLINYHFKIELVDPKDKIKWYQ